VAFLDGSTDEYAINYIAENMYAHVDKEGRQSNIMEKLIDHQKDDNAVTPHEAYITINGKKHPKQTP
jgi:hypothetical protein